MHVILRYWRGWTTHGNAESYQRIVSEQVLPGIAARQIEGYHGAYLLRRDLDQDVEFATVMIFDSLDHVRAFAGEDYETAYVPPAARAVLARFDRTVRPLLDGAYAGADSLILFLVPG